MEYIFKVNNKEYTQATFGTYITACRINKKWSQAELAKEVYKLMHNGSEEEFNAPAERMRLSRVERGKYKPTADYAEAIIEVLKTDNGTPSVNNRLDYSVEVIREISVIIERLPQKSAENLLAIARMIAQGGLRNT